MEHQGRSRRYHSSDLSKMSLEKYLELLPTFDANQIETIIEAATKLTSKPPSSAIVQQVNLPLEIWKLIFNETKHHSLAESSRLYESLHTLLPLRCVSRAWKSSIDEVVDNWILLSSGNQALSKETIYLSCLFTNKAIFNLCMGCCFPNTGDLVKDTVKNLWRIATDLGDPSLYKFLLNDARLHPEDMGSVVHVTVHNGHHGAFEVLLADQRSVQFITDDIIGVAVERGHEKIIRTLLRYYEWPQIPSYSDILFFAATKGRVNIISLLLNDPRVDPRVDYYRCIKNAMDQGCTDVVSLLLQDRRVSTYHGIRYLLFDAIQDSQYELVKLLLQFPFIDPSIHNNYAYRLARQCKEPEMATLLLASQRINRKYIARLARHSNQTHVTWNLGGKRGDAFGIDEAGLTPKQIAEKWATLLGLGKPISYETQFTGRRKYVRYLPNLNSLVSETKPVPWICEKGGYSYPLIFSLVCEKKPAE